MWPIGSLRRYGVNNVCFTIVTGRCVTLDHLQPLFHLHRLRGPLCLCKSACSIVSASECIEGTNTMPLDTPPPMVFAICSPGIAPQVRVAFSSTHSRAGSFTARCMAWPHRRLGEAQRWVVRLLQDLGRGGKGWSLAMNADTSERGSYRSGPLWEKGEWELKSRRMLKHVANSVTCSAVKLIT